MQTLEKSGLQDLVGNLIINVFWAKLCLGPFVMNSVGKVLPNITAQMLCFRALSLLNVGVWE